MQAIILAGGHGTDLRLLTSRRPKHLVPVANRPALAYLIEALREAGATSVGITVNGDETDYRRTLGDGAAFGVPIHYLHETAPQGTAGCLRALRDGMGRDPILVVNANLNFSVDLRGLTEEHRARGAAATIGVRPVGRRLFRDQREQVSIGEDSRVLGISVQYPEAPEDPEWEPAGVYLFSREALDCIPASGYCDLKEQLLPQLVGDGLRVLARPIDGYQRELNSMADYLALHFDVLRGRAGVLPKGEPVAEEIWMQGDAVIAPDALLVGPILLGPGVRIGSGARLIGPLSIGRDAVIGEGALVREAVIGERAVVGERARIERSVLGDDARAAADAALIESVAADQTLSLGDLTLIERELQIATACLPLERYVAARVRSIAYASLKRAFDVACALTGLILAFPIMVIAAAAIVFDSPGGILFGQKRCGRHGREFTMYKFRSMRADAEALQDDLRDRNESDGPVFKITDDPRFTRVGKVLRKYSIDELPQLWNVLCGDMSVVGPRPLARKELRLCPSWQEARLRVKPGLTGLWQVSSREKSQFNEWIRQDLRYVREQSFTLDLKIVFRTVAALAKGL